MQKYYIEHEGRAINNENKFPHVMAITLNPKKDYKEGILYAHVDDSFVRAYTLKVELIKEFLSKNNFLKF